MANYERAVASVTVVDGANRPSVVQVYVPLATAKLFWAAADKAARDATAIGVLFAKLAAVTAGVIQSTSVTLIDETAPISIPAETVLRGNKLVLALASGTDVYRLSIPARDATAYTPKADSIEVDFAAAGDLADFISQLETVSIGKNGLSQDVIKAYVND